ncbi:MAG: hypothetical protein AAGE52_03815 [Myxococcota bacterium]
MRTATPWLVALLACGGATPQQGSTASTETETPVPNLDRFSQRATIELEAGELHLGSNNGGDIAFVIEATNGELVLFACGRVEGETGHSGFHLADVGYEQDGNTERLGGITSELLLQRLANEQGPRIRTCDEEIEIDERQAELLRAFLNGTAPPPEETFESRSIALDGLDLGFAISNLETDVVRMTVQVHDESLPVHDCDIVVLVDGEPFPLGLLDLQEPRGRRQPNVLVSRFPRENVQRLASEDEATLIVCGDVWPLDQMTLRNIRSLVGSSN